MIRAAHTRNFVSVRELLDKLFDVSVILHECDVEGVAGQQNQRFPPIDDVVAEEYDEND